MTEELRERLAKHATFLRTLTTGKSAGHTPWPASMAHDLDRAAAALASEGVAEREADAWIVTKMGKPLGLLYHESNCDDGAEKEAKDYANWLNAGGRVRVGEAAPVYFGTPPSHPAPEKAECEKCGEFLLCPVCEYREADHVHRLGSVCGDETCPCHAHPAPEPERKHPDHPERILARLLYRLPERGSCRSDYDGTKPPQTDFEEAWHEARQWWERQKRDPEPASREAERDTKGDGG